MSLVEIQELLEQFAVYLALPFLFGELIYRTSAGYEHVVMAWFDHTVARIIG